MFQEYTSLSEEELDEKMEDVMKRMNSAHAMGLEGVVEQLQSILEALQLELNERIDTMRFSMISERTPDSLVIGEDDGSDAPADED